MAVNTIKAIIGQPEKDLVHGYIPDLNFSISDWCELIDISEADFARASLHQCIVNRIFRNHGDRSWPPA
jgi:hypothetical protein